MLEKEVWRSGARMRSPRHEWDFAKSRPVDRERVAMKYLHCSPPGRVPGCDSCVDSGGPVRGRSRASSCCSLSGLPISAAPKVRLATRSGTSGGTGSTQARSASRLIWGRALGRAPRLGLGGVDQMAWSRSGVCAIRKATARRMLSARRTSGIRTAWARSRSRSSGCCIFARQRGIYSRLSSR